MKKLMKVLILINLFMHCFEGSIFAQDEILGNFVDKEFHGLTIGKSYLVDLERSLGKGNLTKNRFGVCFYNSKDSNYIIFELCEDHAVCGLLITKDKIWKTDCENNLLSINSITGRGVKLGQSYQEVIKIYGDPYSKDEDNGSLIILYQTDSDHDPRVRLSYDSILIFRNNRLVEIHIHDGP
ncbi:MAG: hypothetical protein OEZ01_11855 [Candidatus Heimdallarchaeota archaeon]|nr:hypothetical protein [Candidatus Heimdallarchaeota archaeon]